MERTFTILGRSIHLSFYKGNYKILTDNGSYGFYFHRLSKQERLARKEASQIHTITSQEASDIIEERLPYGRFILQEGDGWVGIDNRDGYAWTEDFPSKEMCIAWLNDEIDSEGYALN